MTFNRKAKQALLELTQGFRGDTGLIKIAARGNCRDPFTVIEVLTRIAERRQEVTQRAIALYDSCFMEPRRKEILARLKAFDDICGIVREGIDFEFFFQSLDVEEAGLTPAIWFACVREDIVGKKDSMLLKIAGIQALVAKPGERKKAA